MVVEVDDSGWGDLLGGVVIVMRRVDTDEFFSDEIPIELFQLEFKYKIYLRKAIEIILNGIDQLKIKNTEPIHICTGYVFTDASETLNELGYRVVEAKIVGKTQELAEAEFARSLVRLGVAEYHEVREMRSFNKFLQWVHMDLEDRERYVKTGWKSWTRLRNRGQNDEE